VHQLQMKRGTSWKNCSRVSTELSKHVFKLYGGELEAMKMKDSEDVSSYITRVQTVVNQLKHNGETLTNVRIVEKIL